MVATKDDTLEILREARELFRLAKWERGGSFFANKHGIPCDYESAVSCCSLGGIIGAGIEIGKDSLDAESALLRASRKIHDTSLTFFNDSDAKDKQEILDLYDLAIQEVEQHEGRTFGRTTSLGETRDEAEEETKKLFKEWRERQRERQKVVGSRKETILGNLSDL